MTDACGRFSTRTAATNVSYAHIYDRLCRQSGAESTMDSVARLRAVVAWWQSQDGAWTSATIRQYRAAIIATADTQNCTQDSRTAIDAALETLRSHSPAPRSRSAPRRTSARKRKSVSDTDLEIVVAGIMERNDRTARILAGMLLFGILLGLRPCEWPQARVVGTRLSIKSAKATNDRGIPHRVIELDKMGALNIDRLRSLLGLIQIEIKDVGWPKLYARVSKRLSRFRGALKSRNICLYTVRHQCLANAK